MAEQITLNDLERETRSKASEDTEAALQETPADVVSRWLRELQAADQHESEWRDRAHKIVELYKDQRPKGEDSGAAGTYRFNILFSNTEVVKGALYQKQPVPDIRRRYLDKDPVSRVAALVLTRAVSTCLDTYDFDSVMKDCVQDMALPGRGFARVKYVPTMHRSEQRVPVDQPADGAALPADVQQDEQGHFRMEQVEEVVYETVENCYVEWDMVRVSPAKRWQKLRWIGFGELLTRDDCVSQFGKDIGQQIELKWLPKGLQDSEQNQIFKRALVWTIYNKTERKVIVVCDGYKDSPLKEERDPLKLEQFFPSPRPIYAIQTTDTMIPTPEYAVYQDHARQLDEINERIAVLTGALRWRGVRDGSIEELEQLAGLADNKFVGVKNMREFMEKGGLNEVFQSLDLSDLASTIKELMIQADAKKQQIYEIVGIGDIMRSVSDPGETLGAQQLKSQWGSVRLGPRQAEVQRFARDCVRLTAEIIAEHFSAQTLAQMSGVELCADEKERALLVAAAQADPRAADPRIRRPSWEQVMALLRNDRLRSFKIDIETDSTIKAQAETEQKNRVELITAVTGYLEKTLPAVQQGLVPPKVASELLMFGIRSFPVGSQVEELLDEWAGGGDIDQMLGGGAPQANPAQQAAQKDAQDELTHRQHMRQADEAVAQAKVVEARARAYIAVVQAEAAVPGEQLALMREALGVKAAKAAEARPAEEGVTLQ